MAILERTEIKGETRLVIKRSPQDPPPESFRKTFCYRCSFGGCTTIGSDGQTSPYPADMEQTIKDNAACKPKS